MRFLALLAVSALSAFGQSDLLNHNRPVLDAHNCYPYKGEWKDRIERALGTGFPVGIEQDLAWDHGRVVVSHSDKALGSEPTLREHFFERVRPIVEKALAENRHDQWPIIIVHFDFKSNEQSLIEAVWKLLGDYQDWITTATKTADPHQLAPFEPKPLLVLTEIPDAQEEVFFQRVPVGGKLRIFGSAVTTEIPSEPKAEHEHILATMPPEQLLSARPTNYRRWVNFSWHAVEEGGQPQAGAWTPADARRLKSLVDHAHKLGYWIRFYTLDGFSAAENQGWDKSYNFGSREAVMERWKAAISAGVNLIATDQYEELRNAMKP
jgi:hypothetical protein